MSDFLTSLAERSISSSTEVLPIPKARFQADANDVSGVEVTQDVDSRNSSTPIGHTGDRKSSVAETLHLRSGTSADVAMPTSNFTETTNSGNRRTIESRQEGITNQSIPPTPLLRQREIVLESDHEVEVELSKRARGETQLGDVSETLNRLSHAETLIAPIVRNEVPRPVLPARLSKTPTLSLTEFKNEVLAVPQAPMEVQQFTKVTEKIREPIVERVTEIVPSASFQAIPPAALPKTIFHSTASTASTATETVVNVTIGRIEIRAQVESKRNQRAAVKEISNVDSLREYLGRRAT